MSLTILNDQQLREALNDLPLEMQRKLSALFVNNVSHLSRNLTNTQGLQIAKNSELTTVELENAYKNEKN